MPALDNPKQEKFAQLVATGSKLLTAYREATGSKAKTANVNACQWSKRPEIAARIKEIRVGFKEQEEAKATDDIKSRYLTLSEKLAFLADVVRVPIGEVDEKSPLCQSAEYSEAGRKFKMPDKLRALEISAKLQGLFTEKVEHSGSVEHRHVLTEERRKELIERRKMALESARK